MASIDGSTPLSAEASRLFRVYKTMSSMLVRRGYMVPKDMRELTPKSFVDKFGETPSREAMTILVVRGSMWAEPCSNDRDMLTEFFSACHFNLCTVGKSR